MDEAELQSEIENHRKELLATLVSGGNDLASDNKVRGQLLGLEMASRIIHEVYLRFNNGDDTGTDADE